MNYNKTFKVYKHYKVLLFSTLCVYLNSQVFEVEVNMLSRLKSCLSAGPTSPMNQCLFASVLNKQLYSVGECMSRF